MNLEITPITSKLYMVAHKHSEYTFSVNNEVDYMSTTINIFTDDLFVLIFDDKDDVRIELYSRNSKGFSCIDIFWTLKLGSNQKGESG